MAASVIAIVPASRWAESVETRLSELDSSLVQLQADLKKTTLEDPKKAQLLELERSLKAEKDLLLERRALLKRLEAQGLLMYVTPPPAKTTQ